MTASASDCSWATDQGKPGLNQWANEVYACSACSTPQQQDLEEETPICWICLDAASPDKPLVQPCKCPRYCHKQCIARWQLQSAGSRRETTCEFCQSVLPDWKQTLTPPTGARAPAVMNVNFDGRTFSFEVAPGPDGYRQFTEAIRAAFNLPEDSELNITFTCDEPSTGGAALDFWDPDPTPSAGSLLTLQGPGAYDAAVHCASVSAARRALTGSPPSHATPPVRAPDTPRRKNKALSNLGRRIRSVLSDLFVK